jgi:hypothetical protein
MAFKKKDAPKAEPKVDVVAEQMSKMKLRMKSRPNWEDDDFGQDFGGDLLSIPQETIDALARDGVALQWATRSVLGMETKREMRQTYAAGWTPVHLSDFDGIFDSGKFAPQGADEMIAVDACMLVARPMAMHQKEKHAQKREANEPLERTEQMAAQGVPGVTGANHRSVRNEINVYVDRVNIPD